MFFLHQCIRRIHSAPIHRVSKSEVDVFFNRVRAATTADDASSLYADVKRFMKKSSKCKTKTLLPLKKSIVFVNALSSLRVLMQRQHSNQNTEALDTMMKLTLVHLSRMKGLSELSATMSANLTHTLALTWHSHKNTEIMKLQANIAILKIDEFNSKSLLNLSWSFGKTQVPAEELLSVIALKLVDRISEFQPAQLSKIAWTFASAGVYSKDLFNLIASESERRIHEFNQVDLSRTAWAFATAGFYSEQLFKAIASESERCVHEFTPQQISCIAWAFAINNTRIDSLFDSLARASRTCIDDFSVELLTTFAWSCSLTTGSISDTVSEILAPSLSTLCEKILSDSGSSLLLRHQIMFSLFVFSSLGEKYPYMNDLFYSSRSKFRPCPFSISSQFHRDVSAALKYIGVHHDCEVPVCNNLFIVDIYLMERINDRPVILEIDGPLHFFTNYPHIPNGKTAYKRALLKNSGFHVISIPYWDWFGKSKRNHYEYIKNLLRLERINKSF